MREVTTKKVREANGPLSAMYTVSLNGVEVGLIEKYRNTRTDTHPWKAYSGIGYACRFIGAFYGPRGAEEARNAVVAASDERG